jgi:hypothetical protein
MVTNGAHSPIFSVEPEYPRPRTVTGREHTVGRRPEEEKMNHLRNLQLVNYFTAAFYAALGIVLAPLTVGLLHLFGAEIRPGEVAGLYGGLALGTAICLGLAAFAFTMGRRIARGSWRWPQTIYAVISAANNPPIGMVYAAYAMWVCWANHETRGAFERAA